MDILTGIDIVRLATIPLFLYTALTDVRYRRAPDKIWIVLVVTAALLLVIELLFVISSMRSPYQEIRLLLITTSIALSLALGILMHLMGFGGADTKAIISIGLLYPLYPHSMLTQYGLPISANSPVASLDIIVNTFILTTAYPLALIVHNLRRSNVFPSMFLLRKSNPQSVVFSHGTIAIKKGDALSGSSVDLDTLRTYLVWNRATISDIQQYPDRYRSGNTPTAESIGDGTVSSYRRSINNSEPVEDTEQKSNIEDNNDPWRIDEFTSQTSVEFYGRSPDALREILDYVSGSPEPTVWVCPGIPMLLFLAAGLVCTFLFGSLVINIISIVL